MTIPTPEPSTTASPTPTVVLHAERLQIDTVDGPAERVVVRRRITTETRQVDVTVRREVLEVERLPLEQGTRAGAPRDSSPLVVVLSEEVPVVTLHTRPYERVTVGRERVAGTVQVDRAVGHEEVDVTTTGKDLPPAGRRAAVAG